MNEEEIFQAAAALPGAERAAYLLTACAGQPALCERVERLLASHDNEVFMQWATDSTEKAARKAALEHLIPEECGDWIGNYKLLQPIGEGGCGIVYMAQQEKPVRRTVALKIIKLGTDTRSVIARFQEERQALAMMDHPNIAKVFDAGTTGQGTGARDEGSINWSAAVAAAEAFGKGDAVVRPGVMPTMLCTRPLPCSPANCSCTFQNQLKGTRRA